MKKNLFGRFFKENTGLILMYVLCLAIFWIVLFLYQKSLEPVIYATVLSLIALVIFCAVKYSKYVKRYEERNKILSGIDYGWDNLPEADSLLEEDYQEMVKALGKRCAELKTDIEMERKDTLEYYTTWVHQIKTPIAVLQLLLAVEDTKEHRDMQAELFRIEQYVEMVLSYIRLGSDSHDLVFKEMDVDEIVKAVVRKYASQFIRKKISFNYESAHKMIITDDKWFSLILEQMLSNAIKYTWEGSVSVSFSEDGKKLLIKDTGIGIAAEDIPRVFEQGYTGYNGRADKKATGLGLYLAKQAADRLHLKLGVESEPGVGSTFWIGLEQEKLVVE